MFEPVDWSDAEENCTSVTVNVEGSRKPIRFENDGKFAKHKKKGNPSQRKRRMHISSSASGLPNVNINIKKAVSKLGVPVINKHMDACLNSPSMTTTLINDADEEHLPEKKNAKHKKSKKIKTVFDALNTCDNTVAKGNDEPGSIGKEYSIEGESEITKVGSILKKGVKFSSESDFVKFMTQKGKKRKRASKGEKRKNMDGAKDVPEQVCLAKEPPLAPPRKKRKAPIPQNDCQGQSKDSILSISNPFHPDNMSNNNTEKLSISNPFHPKYSELKGATFDIEKLNKLLLTQDVQKKSKESTASVISTVKVDKSEIAEESEARKKLKSSRFRFLNEKLYTQSGTESFKMFKKDDEGLHTFKTYHEGYAEQVKKWPIDPLDLIISSILKKKAETLVIGDFGCGEARLAHALSSTCMKIHSFDLVALNDKVTVCDFTRTPLENESADIVVFCLSLMGTNLRDYLKEANRVMKIGGILKIAEVESRFDGDGAITSFIQFCEKSGFSLKWKDLKKEYFYLFDFKKTSKFNKKKVMEVTLKPCLYKKR